MVLSTNDRHLIRALHEDKKMTISEIVREFPNRHWHKKTVARFIKRLKATGSIERRPGSGLKPTVIPPELVESVLKMIRSKDPDTGTFYSIRKIALLSGASRRMVTKIASTDLGKAPVKKKVTAQTRLKQRVAKAKRLELCSNLLRRFSNKDAVKKIWFSGERCFTLEKPKYVRIESEEKKPTKAAKAKQPAVKAKKQTTKSKKKAADSKNEEDNEEDEEEKVKTDEKDKQVEVEAEKNSSNTETVQHIDVENSNSNIPISTTSVVENRPDKATTISNEIVVPISNNIPSSNVNVPNIPNVNNTNPSCDLSSTNNDVMNLINIYVSNPLNFVSNPTPSYLPDQNCSYAVPNPVANNYCQPPPHGYGVAPNHSGYPGPNSFNYMANCAAQPPPHHHHHHHHNNNNNNNNNNPKSSHHYPSVSSNMNNKSGGGVVGGPTSMKKPTSTQPATTTRISNSVIVSLAVSIGGKSDPIFIDRPSGYLSAECYRREVLSRLLPFIKSKTPDYVFMQDKSTAHQSQNTVKYLQENCPDFIKPEEWPPSCPQLHPIEYFVWKKLQSMVYRGEAIKTVEELKERILKCWSEISQKNIDAALSQWLNKLRAAVKRAKE